MSQAARIDTTAQAEIAQTGLVPADLVPVTPPVAEAPRPRAQASVFQHAAYVIGENPVTGIAFGLFVLIVICAVFGPLIVPYDPLASNTDVAYNAPSAAHWFGTDQLGRDILSRVVVRSEE